MRTKKCVFSTLWITFFLWKTFLSFTVAISSWFFHFPWLPYNVISLKCTAKGDKSFCDCSIFGTIFLQKPLTDFSLFLDDTRYVMVSWVNYIQTQLQKTCWDIAPFATLRSVCEGNLFTLLIRLAKSLVVSLDTL